MNCLTQKNRKFFKFFFPIFFLFMKSKRWIVNVVTVDDLTKVKTKIRRLISFKKLRLKLFDKIVHGENFKFVFELQSEKESLTVEFLRKRLGSLQIEISEPSEMDLITFKKNILANQAKRIEKLKSDIKNIRKEKEILMQKMFWQEIIFFGCLLHIIQ